MKNQYTSTNAISRPGRFGLALAGLMLLAVAASSSATDVIPPSALPYGLSYAEWSAKWWQWALGLNANYVETAQNLVGNPNICGGTASPVRFLPGAGFLPEPGGVAIATNKVYLDAKTPLFFPILAAWDDNSGCPTFTSLTAAELADANAANWSAVSETTCTIDGVAVAGLSNPATTEYLAVSAPFSYTTATTDNVLAGFFGESCIPGDMTIYPAVAEGVYLMIAPLAPGKHTIQTIGEVGSPPFVTLNITYDITVSSE
jgi:hypothetical protein